MVETFVSSAFTITATVFLISGSPGWIISTIAMPTMAARIVVTE
jgi:hypothetical protein